MVVFWSMEIREHGNLALKNLKFAEYSVKLHHKALKNEKSHIAVNRS